MSFFNKPENGNPVSYSVISAKAGVHFQGDSRRCRQSRFAPGGLPHPPRRTERLDKSVRVYYAGDRLVDDQYLGGQAAIVGDHSSNATISGRKTLREMHRADAVLWVARTAF